MNDVRVVNKRYYSVRFFDYADEAGIADFYNEHEGTDFSINITKLEGVNRLMLVLGRVEVSYEPIKKLIKQAA